jgi:peptide/nickel transport system substrate-binding protein
MRSKVVVAVLAVAALIGSSCGGDDESSADSTSASGETEAVARSSESDATQTGDTESSVTESSGVSVSESTAAATSGEGSASESPESAGGALTYGHHASATNLDPDLAAQGDDNVWLFPAYDRLVHLTPDGEFVPGLATEWTISPDGLVLTFALREGVYFHDGSDFNADVAKANLERSLTMEGSANSGALASIASVEAEGPFTLRINLVEPAASLVGTLSDRPGIMISGQALAEGVDLSQTMVGAGMYQLESYQAGDRAVYRRFDGYWDPAAATLDELVIVELPDNGARLAALLDGQIDAARIEPDGLEAAEAAGLNIQTGPTLSVHYIPFRLAEGLPWTTPEVREALAYAIDKQGILNAVFQGSGEVVSQIFPPGYFAASPDVPADSRPFDLERAKSLLDEAGFGEGFTIRVGGPPTLDRVLAEAVQASWAPLNVKLEIVPFESSELTDKWFGGDFDMLLGSWSGRPDPNLTNIFLYSKESTFINYAGYDVPEINELIAASEAASGEDRTALLQQLSAKANEVAFNIPLFALSYIQASAPEVEGLEIFTSSKAEFRAVSVGG